MSYEEFVYEIESRMKEQMKGKREIYIHTAIKNNGHLRMGLTFTESGINISPTIYLEEYYERFRCGSSLEHIEEQILDMYHQVRLQRSWEEAQVTKYVNVRDRVIYQVINFEKNKTMLEEVPHVRYLDLAIVFYVLLEIEPGRERMATMLIRKEHLNWWSVTKEEIFKMAQKNTRELLSCEFVPMYAVVEELLGEKEKEACANEEDYMYVLTNVLRNYGAAAMLYEGELRKIGEVLKENFYILPSSVHEVIIVPESKAIAKEELGEVVTEINETQVPEEEVLSNHVYYYNREKAAVSM